MTALKANQLKSIALMLAVGGACLAVVTLAYLFLAHTTYRASARIKVVDWVHSRDAGQSLDLSRVSAECELLQSDALLDAVIKNLGLAEIWGRRYHAGNVGGADENRARLKAEILAHAVPRSSVIEILVTSDDRDETSRIANELARVYLDNRQAGHDNLITGKLADIKREWDEQNTNITDAQEAVDKLYFEISRARSSNQTQLYDSDAYETLLSKRIALEGELVARQNQMDQFQKLPPEELIQVLSTSDENSAINPPLLQLVRAKNALSMAKLDHGPDSSEIQSASRVVDDLNKRISEVVRSTMAVKQTELRGIASALDEVTLELKGADTNVSQAALQYGRYRQALTNLNTFKEEREVLQKKINDEEAAEASRPTGITATLLDQAETPDKPFTPNRKLAALTLAVAMLLMLAAFGVFLSAQRPSTDAVKKPA